MDSPKPPSRTPIGPALRALAARARRDLGDRHPEAAELVGYHEGTLGEKEAERVRDHLALCPDCAGLVLELAEFSGQAPSEASGLTTREVEEAWRSLAPRLAAAYSQTAPPPPRRAPVSLPWALAATLLLGVVALSTWAVVLRQDLRELSRPRADAVVANLEPNGEGTRGETAGRQERPRADRPATLILHALPPRGFSGYELQILEAGHGGRVVWQGGGLHPRELGFFVLDLPAGALPPGKYLVRLYGVAAERREPLADFDLVIGGE
jgi:Putative zinc-finger